MSDKAPPNPSPPREQRRLQLVRTPSSTASSRQPQTRDALWLIRALLVAAVALSVAWGRALTAASDHLEAVEHELLTLPFVACLCVTAARAHGRRTSAAQGLLLLATGGLLTVSLAHLWPSPTETPVATLTRLGYMALAGLGVWSLLFGMRRPTR